MPHGSVTERLQEIQRRLGVRPDGILGPVTLSALEAALDTALGPLPVAANLIVSQRSLDEIVHFEVTSFANYEANLSHPTWPGGASGVTIGIGYDLGANTRLQSEGDWRGEIADAALERLLDSVGITGTAARELLPQLTDIEVPLLAARRVFFSSTLPRYAGDTRRGYPGIEGLPADAQGMLLSLVFNRGASMANTDRRREMRQIRPLVVAGDLAGIAAQVRAMKRLWDVAELPGLHRRRDREAELIAGSDRAYELEELVAI